jgi:type II secretory pathway component PulF
LPWALQELAETCTRRTDYRIEVLGNLLFPLTVIGLGIIVGFFAIAAMLPLFALIGGLSR